MDLRRKLEVISNIKPDSTLNIHGEPCVVMLGSWTSIGRKWYGENRSETVKWIADVITSAIRLLNTQMDIYTQLKLSQKGISNLRETYSDDPEIYRRLLNLDNLINEEISKFENRMLLTFENLPKYICDNMTPSQVRLSLDSPHVIQTPIYSHLPILGSINIPTITPNKYWSLSHEVSPGIKSPNLGDGGPSTPPSSPRIVRPFLINPFVYTLGYSPVGNPILTYPKMINLGLENNQLKGEKNEKKIIFSHLLDID